ncbi:MAG TPA: hypothetical protein VJ302_15040 [Blastocatellia bacterium]|nr:hypothetical protein [Blastocatellia bacterium]
MRKELEVSQEAFDRLLAWLHTDRNLAGEKYEVIRRGLTLFFERRGCLEVADLADQTIDRVIGKLPEIAAGYTGEPAKYFYGVAHRIYQEYLRRPHPTTPLPQPEDSILQERKDQCRERCLNKLSEEDRLLITGYYLKEKQEKIEYRRQLAAQHGLTSNALAVRACRIRAALVKCLEECLEIFSRADVIDRQWLTYENERER